METTGNLDLLLKWLKNNHVTETYESKEHFIVLVYTKSDYKFDETIPQEFWNVPVQFHYPEIIVLPSGETYLPTTSKYNPKLEFITLKIGK